jgi:hypothetical protein
MPPKEELLLAIFPCPAATTPKWKFSHLPAPAGTCRIDGLVELL